MAITLQTYPPLVALAKNPVVFGFESDNVVITPGVKCFLPIEFFASLAADETFTLAWGSNSITFTAKATPDSSGTQFKTIVGGQSLNAWCVQTAGYLNQNYILSRDFEISPNGTVWINITARETGDDYTLTLTSAQEPAKLDEGVAYVAGTTEVLQDFFSILLQTFIKDGAYMLQKFEDALDVYDSYNAIADISEVLKSELYSEFEWPEAAANSFKKREHILLPYFIRYCEQYGNPLVQKALTTSGYYWALNGGVPFWKQVEYYSAGTSFWDRMQYEMNFLTWQPRTKKTDLYQAQSLYFLAWKSTLNGTLCRLKITLIASDGDTLITHSGDQAISYMDVFEIQVGYDRLEVLYDMGIWNHTVVAYEIEVEVKAGGLLLSEKFHFDIDRNEYPNKRYFRFLNSLGGFDDVMTTGIGEFELAPERTVITCPYPKVFNTAFQMKKNIFISGAQKMKVNTGWKTKEEIDWLQDMMLSEEVYEVINGDLYPIVITSTSGPKYVDEQSPAYFMEFEYERSAHDTTYAAGTVPPTGGDFSEDYNDDFLT